MRNTNHTNSPYRTQNAAEPAWQKAREIREEQMNRPLNYCTKVIPLCFALDDSGSMSSRMSNGKTRYEAAAENFAACIQSLIDDGGSMIENIHLFVCIFGGNGVEWLATGQPLFEVDVQELLKKIRAIAPSGSTPMYSAIDEGLSKMEELKEHAKQYFIEYAQPSLVLVTDGEPTDVSLGDRVKERIYSAMRQDNQKLLVLPIGVGEPGTSFQVLSELVRECRLETPVVTRAEEFREYFVILDKTLRQIESGAFVSEMQLPNFVTTPASQFGASRSIADNARRTQGGDN